MKTDNSNSKIFHSIIQDLTDMIEKLRIENENMNDLIMDKQKLENTIQELSSKVKDYENKNYYGNLTLYFLVMSLSIFLALPPNM